MKYVASVVDSGLSKVVSSDVKCMKFAFAQAQFQPNENPIKFAFKQIYKD